MCRPGRATVLAVVLLTAVIAAGCDEQLSDVTGPTPNLEPTFSVIQRDIFSAADSSGRPACTGCHNPQSARFNGELNPAGDEAYGELVNAASTGQRGAVRVRPGEPDGSYLVHKVEGAPDISGVRMPLGGPYLTAGQILVLRRWIALGAPNN